MTTTSEPRVPAGLGYLCRYEWDDEGNDALEATTDGGLHAIIEADEDVHRTTAPRYQWRVRVEWYSPEDGHDWDEIAEGTADDWVLALAAAEATMLRQALVNEALEEQARDAAYAAAEQDSQLAAIEAELYDIDDPEYNP